MVEVEVVVVERLACYIGEKRGGQSEPGAEFGFEAAQRTAPSGCGRANPEAEALGSEEERVRGSGPERRVAALGAASSASQGLVWSLQACPSAGWLDLASEAVRRCLPPSLAEWGAGQCREDQESRAVRGERQNTKSDTCSKPAETNQTFIMWVADVNLLHGLGSFEDLEMDNLSAQAYHHLLSHRLEETRTVEC